LEVPINARKKRADTDKITYAEWRGKVTAILEQFSISLSNVELRLDKLVTKEAFEDLKGMFLNLEVSVCRLADKIKEIEIQQCGDTSRNNFMKEIFLILISALVGVILGYYMK
jgi:hypothetical protein